MAMTLEKLRTLLDLDPDDPLSRYALGRKLLEHAQAADSGSSARDAALLEAVEHLRRANAGDPDHGATYHVLGQVLVMLDRLDEARTVLREGCRRTAGLGEGMGRDLAPMMEAVLRSIDAPPE